MARAEFNQKAIQRQIEKQKKRLIAAGFQIEREAKQLCPVDQGRLRASISTNWTDSGLAEAKTGEKAESWDGVLSSDVIEDGNFKVVVGTNVFYSVFIEYGTYKIPAIPYMRAAFGKYANRIGALMAEASQTGMVDGEEF